ncbi:hypothetical protein GTS_44110 [Gandjariella thermophila]|uniref:Uncharacterized protein n=1 Tax=Gandjariella thermophila TaxID=1931992 RepID=A0A4D4JDQ3_9PSEU|nr:hypothetical protein GTS_44110 [Gandjariella thermophila]
MLPSAYRKLVSCRVAKSFGCGMLTSANPAATAPANPSSASPVTPHNSFQDGIQRRTPVRPRLG